jgi:PKD repeat protein
MLTTILTVPISGYTNTTNFSFSSDAYDPNGINYIWDFGDGTFSSLQYPSHIYDNSGTYTVSLTALYTDSTYDSVSSSVYVSYELVKPDISIYVNPTLYGYTNSTTFTFVPDLSSLGYYTFFNWDFGNGDISTDTQAIYKYADSGTYTVSVTGYNSIYNTEDIGSVEINVGYFQVSPKTGYANGTVFSFFVSVPDFIPMPTYLWDFGDGEYSRLPSPQHIYKIPKDYTVTLTIFGSDGSTITYSSDIKVVLFLNESLYFKTLPPPTYAGHLNRYPFEINITSSTVGDHYIDLGAQFSDSYQYQDPENKWSFLRPQWRFLDLSGNRIDTIKTVDTPIAIDNNGNITNSGLVIGVTGTAQFYFVDDLYNSYHYNKNEAYSTIIATLQTSGLKALHDSKNLDFKTPSFANSLATIAVPHIFLNRDPDYIKITENGLNQFSKIKFVDQKNPMVVTLSYNNHELPIYGESLADGNSFVVANKQEFFHGIPSPVYKRPLYLSGYYNNLEVPYSPFDISISPANEFTPYSNLIEFYYSDNNGFKTGGYYKGSFVCKTSTVAFDLLYQTLYPIEDFNNYKINPILWISNPEAGMLATAFYFNNSSLNVATQKYLDKVHIKAFDMPVVQPSDIALQNSNTFSTSGFHGINCIASLGQPTFHAWAADSELSKLYRINSIGQILCSIDLNSVINDNGLKTIIPNQTSPLQIVLDESKNFWVTLHDTPYVLKFDDLGRYLTYTDFTTINLEKYNISNYITAYWSMDDSSWSDSTANGYNLTSSGNVSLTSGILNNAASLSGGYLYNDEISMNDEFSISCWFNLTKFDPQHHFTPIWATGKTQGDEITMFITSDYYLGLYDTYGNFYYYLTPEPISTNTWYHIVFSYSSQNNEATIYLDGQPLYTIPTHSSLEWSGIEFGNVAFGSGVYYRGIIDEVFVFDTAIDFHSFQLNSNVIRNLIPLLYNNGNSSSYNDLINNSTFDPNPWMLAQNPVSTNDDQTFYIQPNSVDTDFGGNVWVTYSNEFSGFLASWDSSGNNLFTYSYPPCSCPQELVCDNQYHLWVVCADTVSNDSGFLEKRDTLGTLVSSFGPFKGLNHITIDNNQCPWFTFSYNWVGTINNITGDLTKIQISDNSYSTNPPNWFDPNFNTDETALEGIATDTNGRVFVINSIENKIFVIDLKTKQIIDTFILNPKGFVYSLSSANATGQDISFDPWSKSAQATGDWTGARWNNKYQYFFLYQNQYSYINGSYYKQLYGSLSKLSYTQVNPRYVSYYPANYYDLFKINETFDMASQLRANTFQQTLKDSDNLYNKFLGSIFGKDPFNHEDLGVKSYEKIANFVSNQSDIDTCEINALYDMAESVDLNTDDFKLNYPLAIQRAMSLLSINQSKLFGSYLNDSFNFSKPSKNNNFNRGILLDPNNYFVFAGTPVVLKIKSLNSYRYISTGEYFDNPNIGYTLDILATSLGLPENWKEFYEFYEYIPMENLINVENLIDWNYSKISRNDLINNIINNNPALSAIGWENDFGIMEFILTNELYKGLELI